MDIFTWMANKCILISQSWSLIIWIILLVFDDFICTVNFVHLGKPDLAEYRNSVTLYSSEGDALYKVSKHHKFHKVLFTSYHLPVQWDNRHSAKMIRDTSFLFIPGIYFTPNELPRGINYVVIPR